MEAERRYNSKMRLFLLPAYLAIPTKARADRAV